MNIEEAAERTIAFMKRMGYSFVQVMSSGSLPPDEEGRPKYEFIVDVGTVRTRLGHVVMFADTGEIVEHKVER